MFRETSQSRQPEQPEQRRTPERFTPRSLALLLTMFASGALERNAQAQEAVEAAVQDVLPNATTIEGAAEGAAVVAQNLEAAEEETSPELKIFVSVPVNEVWSDNKDQENELYNAAGAFVNDVIKPCLEQNSYCVVVVTGVASGSGLRAQRGAVQKGAEDATHNPQLMFARSTQGADALKNVLLQEGLQDRVTLIQITAEREAALDGTPQRGVEFWLDEEASRVKSEGLQQVQELQTTVARLNQEIANLQQQIQEAQGDKGGAMQNLQNQLNDLTNQLNNLPQSQDGAAGARGERGADGQDGKDGTHFNVLLGAGGSYAYSFNPELQNVLAPDTWEGTLSVGLEFIGDKWRVAGMGEANVSTPKEWRLPEGVVGSPNWEKAALAMGVDASLQHRVLGDDVSLWLGAGGDFSAVTLKDNRKNTGQAVSEEFMGGPALSLASDHIRFDLIVKGGVGVAQGGTMGALTGVEARLVVALPGKKKDGSTENDSAE